MITDLDIPYCYLGRFLNICSKLIAKFYDATFHCCKVKLTILAYFARSIFHFSFKRPWDSYAQLRMLKQLLPLFNSKFTVLNVTLFTPLQPPFISKTSCSFWIHVMMNLFIIPDIAIFCKLKSVENA